MQQPQSQRPHSESPDKPDLGNVSRPTTIEVYWAIYGKWSALIASPYLWIAVGLTGVCFPLWTSTDQGVRIWAQIAIDTVPSMLGFSLGGMAILLAISSPRLLSAIRDGGKVDSLFMKTVAAFFHFILLQTSAICVALISKSYSYDLISFLGFFLMVYGILVAVAIAGLLLNIARIFNATGNVDE